METSLSPYDLSFSRYAQISLKNWAHSLKNWCHLNFDDGFEFEELKNIYDRHFLQIKRIR